MRKQKTLYKHPFCRSYWKDAVGEFSDLRTFAIAALIIALRVAVKFFKIPLSQGLDLTFDCYVNSIGSAIYGPVVGLIVGAISDTIGCIIAPNGTYFFPFILVEMGSSFLFGLFFWRQKITVGRTIAAKFTVNLVCNIVMNTLFMRWYYLFYFGVEKAEAYNLINLVRICKNLVLFPIEGVLICLLFSACIPALKSLELLPAEQGKLIFTKKHLILIAVAFLLSVGLVLFYIFFLKNWIGAHNVKLF